MKTYVTFKYPYVLIEDTKGKYQPIYKEYSKDIPFINLDSPTLCCPFTTAKRSTKAKKMNPIKAGYCEICYTKFDDYKMHVLTKDHVEYAKNDANYRKIDAFIQEMDVEQRVYSADFMNSPCDRLEIGFSQNNGMVYSDECDPGSVIRFSRDTSDNQNEIVPFDIILNSIEKKFSQDK